MIASSNNPEFISAIQAEPANDSLRLVFADWLEERNDRRGDLLRWWTTNRPRILASEPARVKEMRFRDLKAAAKKLQGWRPRALAATLIPSHCLLEREKWAKVTTWPRGWDAEKVERGIQ